MREIKDLLEKERFEEAVEKLDQSIEADPMDEISWYYKLLAKHGLKDEEALMDNLHIMRDPIFIIVSHHLKYTQELKDKREHIEGIIQETLLPKIKKGDNLALAKALKFPWLLSDEVKNMDWIKNTLDEKNYDLLSFAGFKAYKSKQFDLALTCLEKSWALKKSDRTAYYLYLVHKELEDYEKAIKFLEIASENGFLDAMFDYGVELSNGNIIEEDEDKAKQLWRNAANKDHPYACLFTSIHETDEFKATFLRIGALNGVSMCQYKYAQLSEVKNDPFKYYGWNALAYYVNDDDDAALAIATMLYEGEHGVEDKEKALKILQELAKKGHLEGMAEYGFRKVFDENDTDEESISYLKKAAEASNLKAVYFYARWLEKEKGDKEQAIKYYEKAVELGYDAAQNDLYALRDKTPHQKLELLATDIEIIENNQEKLEDIEAKKRSNYKSYLEIKTESFFDKKMKIHLMITKLFYLIGIIAASVIMFVLNEGFLTEEGITHSLWQYITIYGLVAIFAALCFYVITKLDEMWKFEMESETVVSTYFVKNIITTVVAIGLIFAIEYILMPRAESTNLLDMVFYGASSGSAIVIMAMWFRAVGLIYRSDMARKVLKSKALKNFKEELQNEYDQALEKYLKEDNEVIEIIEQTNDAIERVKSNDILPDKFKEKGPVFTMLAYFEDARVETIKEAINLYVKELKEEHFQDEVLKEQKRATAASQRLADTQEEMAQEQRRSNRQVERDISSISNDFKNR